MLRCAIQTSAASCAVLMPLAMFCFARVLESVIRISCVCSIVHISLKYRPEIDSDLRSALLDTQVTNGLRIKHPNLVPDLGSADLPASSCAKIYESNETAQNGDYFVPDKNTTVFCRFDLATVATPKTNGWQLLTYLDMNDPDTNCPSEFRFDVVRGIRHCRKDFDGDGCGSILYPHNRPIRRLYGRVHGIHSGTLDIEDAQFSRGIDGTYIDGISLTYGQLPRRHIWSFISFLSAVFPNCPCSTNAERTTPSYIGENYFCESGTSATMVDPAVTFVDDPVWDGQNCEITQDPGCCTRGYRGNGEWFYREFEVPFVDDVELRICTDELRSDEDIALRFAEIYFD